MREDMVVSGRPEPQVNRKPWYRPELTECVVPDLTGNGGAPNSDGTPNTTSGAPG